MNPNSIPRRVLAFRELYTFQLMCLMFAGFKCVAPDQDVGMDLEEPFLTALQLFNEKRPKS